MSHNATRAVTRDALMPSHKSLARAASPVTAASVTPVRVPASGDGDMPSQTSYTVSTDSKSDGVTADAKYDSEGLLPERETWVNKLDFLLACIGFSVGLGNVWRFPYLCYKNGGGAFLLPYLICVVIGGVPLFFIEVAVGQFMSLSGIHAWKICPILQGIGWATTSVVFFVNCYYNIILTWALYYFFASFTFDLPWDSCDNYWNTEYCRTSFDIKDNKSDLSNQTQTDPTTEFWERKVLSISKGIDTAGVVKWDLLLCLLLSWILVYFCIWKGVKSSGKVVYFTATSPYLLLTILLIRTCLLDGAKEGIIFYIWPDFTSLSNMQVWIDAGTQIFYSYGIALGGLTALGSFNKFHHNSYRDSVIFACTNSGTSIFAGFTIFAVLGFMAKQQNVLVAEVAESGPGLAFIAYPKAVSQMPAAPFWSAIFFFMIILLGLDSQFVAVEGFVTAFIDVFPSLRRGSRRECFVAFTCFIKFLVGISMITEGGMYVFQLFDYYAGSRIILLVGFFECVAIAWIYGIDRFYDNLEMMFGFRINPFMKFCWMFASPLFCVVIFVLSTINYSELTYRRPLEVYTYPGWALVIGWMLAVVSILWIPITSVYKIFQYRWKGKPLWDLLQPEGLKPHQLRPQDIGAEPREVYMQKVYDLPELPISPTM